MAVWGGERGGDDLLNVVTRGRDHAVANGSRSLACTGSVACCCFYVFPIHIPAVISGVITSNLRATILWPRSLAAFSVCVLTLRCCI